MSDKIQLFLVAISRDGGTKSYYEKSVLETIKTIEDAKNAPRYCIDGRFRSDTRGELFDRYPGEEGAIMLDKNNFEFQ